MTGANAQDPEDYGYDLAHEARSGEPDRHDGGPEEHADGPPALEVEPEGDYGYDEAHDL